MAMPGRYDLTQPAPIGPIDLFETYDDDEQRRRISWVRSMKSYYLDTLLHETRYKSKEVKAKWAVFVEKRKAVLGATPSAGYRCAYRPSKDGHGRLGCEASYGDLFPFQRNLLLAPVASLCGMRHFSFVCARWLAREEGYVCNNLNGYRRNGRRRNKLNG